MLTALRLGRDEGVRVVGRVPAAGGTAALPVPAGPGELQSHYDLTVSHPLAGTEAFRAFDDWLGDAAAAHGLSCCLLHDAVLAEATGRIEQGRMTVGFHLDYYALWHVPGDPYARLAEAVQDSGGQTVNNVDRARYFTDKALAHRMLVSQGLGVPATVTLDPGTAVDGLPAAAVECLRPGAVYVKPANGFGGKGVVRVERPEPAALAAAVAVCRGHDRRDRLLLQREVRCPRLACEDGVERPAYWRILWCHGEVLPFWWGRSEVEHGRPSYRPLAQSEVQRYGLRPVLEYATDLAEVCGLNWFSTELCLSDGAEPSRHRVTTAGREWPVVAIDYVNDQCDMDVQSRWLGAPPDAVVRHVAERFARLAWERSQILPFRRTRWQPELVAA